jgi:hypothetical protein
MAMKNKVINYKCWIVWVQILIGIYKTLVFMNNKN